MDFVSCFRLTSVLGRGKGKSNKEERDREIDGWMDGWKFKIKVDMRMKEIIEMYIPKYILLPTYLTVPTSKQQ